jgi:broad specificity phosphatase PhoE
MEIVLARHGRPNLHVNPWAWMTPRQAQSLIAAYANAGIVVETVPVATLDTARASGVVVSSMVPRSIQSARALNLAGPVLSESLFDEPGPPSWTWPFPKLPLWFWGLIFRLAWFGRLPTNTEPLAEASVRAGKAAQRLIALARERGSVFLMGHAMMNVLIARHLTAAGWSGRIRLLPNPWEFAVFRIQLDDVARSSAA